MIRQLEYYYPIMIVDGSDDVVDYIVMVNNTISFEEFKKAVNEAINQMCDEGYDYDSAFWDEIRRHLPSEWDCYEYSSVPKLYY